MIHAKELRIGNKIKYTNHDLTVLALGKNGYVQTEEHIDGYLEEYDPIPLTPEILEKCVLDHGFSVYHDGMEYNFLFEDDVHGSKLNKPVKYLHQLQNLYHSLTQTNLHYI